MVNWDRLNASIRSLARALPLTGILFALASVLLAIFRRDVALVLLLVPLGLILSALGLMLEGPHPDGQPAPPPLPPAPKEPEAPEARAALPMFCPHCGAKQAESGQKFCISCGKPLAPVSDAPRK